MQSHQDRPNQAESLEDDIRLRARGRATHLRPAQAANLVNGQVEAEAGQTYDEFLESQRAVEILQEAYPSYFQAAHAVAKSESAADLGRFRSWRKEQRRLARAADGPAASAAPGVRLAGLVLPVAGLLAVGLNLIGYPALLAVWALSAALYLLGVRLLKRRRSPLWLGVFADPKDVCSAVWYAAAQVSAAELIRARESDAGATEAGLREVEENWALCNRRSVKFSEEDYSGIIA